MKEEAMAASALSQHSLLTLKGLLQCTEHVRCSTNASCLEMNPG